VNTIDKYGNSLLHLAIFHNKYSTINNILDNENFRNFNTTNEDGVSPFGLACKRKNIYLIDLFLQHNIEVTANDIDVLFYGTASPKRGQWLSDVLFHIHETVNAVCLTNIFHPTIESYINRSKIVINIHNAPSVKQQEQPRLGYLLTNGKHIISEKSSINYYGDLITEVNNWKEMVISIHDILKNYDIENEKNIKNRFSQISYEHITEYAKQELETKILK
jgi:hypothetical protein